MSDAIQLIKTKLGAGARTNLFRAYIFFPFATPNLDDKSYVTIQKVVIPEIKVEEPITKIFPGGHEVKFSRIDRKFSSISFTILNASSFDWRKNLERYIEFISPWGEDIKAEPTEYERDLIVESRGLKGEVLRKYIYKYAFPVNISSIDLDVNTEDIQTFNVTFAYSGVVIE